jgi:hypothetical protein
MASSVTTTVTGAVAAYSCGDQTLRLPIVGLDHRDRAVVLGRKGRAVLATKARPKIDHSVYRFDALETGR